MKDEVKSDSSFVLHPLLVSSKDAPEEPLVFRAFHVISQAVGELLEQVLLVLRKPGRDLHLDDHVLITPAATVQIGDALIAQPECRAGLGAFGKGDLLLSADGRDPYLPAESCHGKADRHFAVEVVVAPLEDLVRAD